MTQQPPYMPPPPEPGRPSPDAPPGGFVPQPRQSGYGPPGYGPPTGYGPPPGYGPPGYGPPGHVPGQPGYGPMPGYPVRPPPASPSGQPLASFTDRLLAYLVDGAILGGVLLLISIPAFVIFFSTAGADFFVALEPDATTGVVEPDVFGDFLLPFLLLEAGLLVGGFALQYIYQVEMAKRTGQTVGKRVMKIKVIPLDPAGTIGRSFLARRFLVQVGGGLVPGMAYVDGLWQLWDKPYQQCLHDKFAKTVVVKVPA